MKYRPEIDGLRAIAILPVIFFHAGFDGFSGGYIGVDIFYVISGYLITSLILSEKDCGTFKLANFYERRARRILPALFFVMAICMPFAWALLLPQDLKAFSESIVAVVTFVSNIFFWRTSGYFEQASELKPLLHTWSLSVEEQFYLFFPLLLLALWRFGKQKITFALVTIFFASLTFAHLDSKHNPNAAFFLLPTRVWELLVGAFIPFYFQRAKVKFHNLYANEFASLIGFSLIIFSIAKFDSAIPYPSLYTLAPTLGAALIIIYGQSNTTIGRLLSTTPFTFIGLLSYSTYLWHQPLFAFARRATQPTTFELAALCAISVLLAYISWKFIETPFRQKVKFNQKQIFTYSILGIIIFICIGSYGIWRKGDLGQVSGEKKDFLAYFDNTSPEWQYSEKLDLFRKIRNECNFFDIPKYRIGQQTRTPLTTIDSSCYTNPEDKKIVFIWGDSHAQRLYWGLKQNQPTNWTLLQVASSGCSPKIIYKENKQDYCDYSNWFAIQKIQTLKPQVVLIGQNIDHNPDDMKTIAKFLLLQGASKVIFTGPTPHWRIGLPYVIASEHFKQTPRYITAGLDKSILTLDHHLKNNFPESERVKYISLIDYFCNTNGCITHFGNDIRTGISSNDEGHLTPTSSIHLAKDLLGDIVFK